MTDVQTPEIARPERFRAPIKEIDPVKIKDTLSALNKVWPEWRFSASTYAKHPARSPEDFDLRKWTFESKFGQADQITLELMPDENMINIEIREMTRKRVSYKGINVKNVSVDNTSVNFRSGDHHFDENATRVSIALGMSQPNIYGVIKSKELGKSEFAIELKTGLEKTYRLKPSPLLGKAMPRRSKEEMANPS